MYTEEYGLEFTWKKLGNKKQVEKLYVFPIKTCANHFLSVLITYKMSCFNKQCNKIWNIFQQ